MPKPNFSDYMRAVFSPLIDVSLRADLIDKLKTAPLDKAIEKSQYERLADFSIIPNDILLLSSNIFLARFKCQNIYYIVLNMEYMSKDEKAVALEFFRQENLVNQPMEACFFLALRYYIKTHYKIKKDLRNLVQAQNIVDIVSDSYKGHDISDLVECYEDVEFFEVPADSVYAEENLWYVAAKITCVIDSFRSPLISPDLATKIGKLLSHDTISSDNIYVALTAIHWKYIFFELYKCLERVFFLPWHYDLKRELSYQLSAANLAKLCQSRLAWRAKEDNSIRNLFELVEEKVFTADLRSVASFRSIASVDLSKPPYGRLVYKIRNELVHHQDQEDPTPTNINDREWPIIIAFVCDTVDNIYLRFNSDIAG